MTTAVEQTAPITGLTGEWHGLSPSSPLSRPITEVLGSGSVRYPTLRKAYHGMRTRDTHYKARIVAARSTDELLLLIPQVPEHPEWPLVQERVMMQLLREKFSDVSMRDLLMKTGHRPLVHRTETKDLYWGTDRAGNGHNRYGHLLMKLRHEFHQSQKAA